MEAKPKTPPPAFTPYQSSPIPVETPPVPAENTPPPHSPDAVHGYAEPSPSPEYCDPSIQQEKHLSDLSRTQSTQAPERVPSHGSIQYLTATPIYNLTRGPAPVDCPACGRRVMTECSVEIGNFTHLWGALTCFFTCLGCIPYFISSLKDVKHSCSKCGTLLAVWHRSGGGVDVLAHQTK